MWYTERIMHAYIMYVHADNNAHNKIRSYILLYGTCAYICVKIKKLKNEKQLCLEITKLQQLCGKIVTM